MNREVFKYLKEKISTNPFKVDRLLVSAFLISNNITIRKNTFLKNYLITNEQPSEYKKLNELLILLKKTSHSLSLEELIKLFEYVISPSDRIVSGAVYTPKSIRDYIVKKSITKIKAPYSDLLVADISSGCGGFLYSVALYLKNNTKQSFKDIFERQIFGLDIQHYSITRTKILLGLLAISHGEDDKEIRFNLFTGDALDFEWSSVKAKFSGFDAILGNPPYVCSRNIAPRTRRFLSKYEVCSTGHPDLYIPFFQIGIESLKENGVLGYITMNSFFKSLNGRALRSYLQKHSYDLSILDFGTHQVFASRNTYTCICLLQKKKSNNIKYTSQATLQLEKASPKFALLAYQHLNSIKGWNLNNNTHLQRIEATGIPFGEIFTTRNGIATLKNNIYIFNPVAENKDFYHLQNGSLFDIEKEICKDIVNPNKLNTATNLSGIKEKIIFPYEYVNGKAKPYTEAFLKNNFPRAFKYLQAKKGVLAERDKGKGEYDKWFAYGRNQSLERTKYKLLFPHISDKTPNYIINADEDLLFYNGIAVISDSLKQLTILKKIMQSSVFWYYVSNSSKPYSSSYFSLSRNYIKNFGICHLTSEEQQYVLNENDKKKLDSFFAKKYGFNENVLKPIGKII